MRDRQALVVVIHPRRLLSVLGNVATFVVGMIGLWAALWLAAI